MIVTILTEIIQAIHKAWSKRDAKRDLIAEVPQLLRRNKGLEKHIINNFTIHPNGYMTGFVDIDGVTCACHYESNEFAWVLTVDDQPMSRR